MTSDGLNCLKCGYIDKTNGNCTAVGGFCTAVPAAHCPLIPELKNEIALLKKENSDILTILHAYRHICGGMSPNEVQTLIKEGKRVLYGEI